ncbi:MAG: GIY-YIG nuclease family protein [Patescibacteria group bacterium]|jgi:putative endonuclease
MYNVYILKLANADLYVGSTGNIKNRIKQHQAGQSQYTKKCLPVKLIYFECYCSKKDALIREKFLKSGRGREVIKKQLENTLKVKR